MPGFQREPGWLRAPGSSYSKGIGSVDSSLPLAGPDEGSILEIFELISVWLKQPIFSYQLLGDIGGAISLAQRGVTRSRGGPATGRCGGHTQVSRQAKHYAHKGINALSCEKAFQNPCHSAKRERKYVQQHIRICTHGVKTGLG